MRKILALMVLFVLSVLTVSMVSALDDATLEIKEIEVNGHDVDFVGDDVDVLAVDEGEKLEVELLLENVGAEDIKDIEVEVEISGYEYDDFDNLEDSTSLFRIKAGTTKPVRLELDLPYELDSDEYWLRVRVMDKNTGSLDEVVRLSVEPKRHAVAIADVAFAPGTTVKAGRSLLTTVLLENYGEKDQKDVKVQVSMPELGISATEFVDDVDNTDDGYENFDFEDVPEMFLPIPANTAAGTYQVVVTATFDDFRRTVSKTYQVQVVENEMFKEFDKLVMAVGPESQNVAAGATARYGVALTNAGTSSKAYTLEVATGDWATASVSEVLVVLEPNTNKVVYVDVTPAGNTVAGSYVTSATVKSGGEALQTVTLQANVVAGDGSNSSGSLGLRNGLEIALIVLVVILVIIGLIIGFSRLKKDEDDEEQTYY